MPVGVRLKIIYLDREILGEEPLLVLYFSAHLGLLIKLNKTAVLCGKRKKMPEDAAWWAIGLVCPRVINTLAAFFADLSSLSSGGPVGKV